MPFSGELVHAAWLKWISQYAPDVATWLHEGNKRRLFTCSSLQFPLPAHRMQEAEQRNIHLPLDPARTYTIRITLLLDDLFPLFYDSLQQFSTAAQSSSLQPFIKLGKLEFLLEEVQIEEHAPHTWTGYTSFFDLAETVQQQSQRELETLTLEFASLTTFNRSSLRNGKRQIYYARLPLPQFVFPGLTRRWQELAPPELVDMVQPQQIEHYIQQDGIIIEDYNLHPHHVHFVTHTQKGFIGSCSYQLRDIEDLPAGNTPLSIQMQIQLLARLAFYTGIGYKPAMGMGRSCFRARTHRT
jgi:CRISPR-associated endoribonuclease Cas6